MDAQAFLMHRSGPTPQQVKIINLKAGSILFIWPRRFFGNLDAWKDGVEIILPPRLNKKIAYTDCGPALAP